MKKIFALMLVLVMCLTLAACGDKPAQGEDESTSNSSQPISQSSEPVSESSEPASESSEPSESQAAAPVVGDEKDFNKVDVTDVSRICDMEVTGMKMSKEKYDVDEPITVAVSWNGTPAEDTWIGIIPAETPHGTEEVNDQFDVAYFYFTEKSSGDSFVFEGVPLEPGDYTMRINESDAGGAELAWCEFTVK